MEAVFYGKIKEYTGGAASFTPGAVSYTDGATSYIPGQHPTLRSLLDELNDHYGDGFESFVRSDETCLILVNGNGVKLSGGLETPLKQGDRIEFLPFVGAG